MVLDKIKGIILSTSASIINYVSVYGPDYRRFLSDGIYKKGKKIVKKIKQ